MKLTKILTIVFLAGSMFFAFKLYRSVQGTIEERVIIKTKEQQITERLRLIREGEIVFREVYGRYTANWDSLTNFIKQGRVPIIERREEIKMKAYGGEDVILHIDTLGYVSAHERIFKKKYTLNAPDDAVFKKYRVNIGDRVVKNQKSLDMLVNGKVQSPPFSEAGIITNLAKIKEGDTIHKGQGLIAFWDYQFDPNVDLSTIGNIPYSPEIKFDIFVGIVDRNGVKVRVIEVKDPKPVNPIRSENNEAKSRKPLRFGSRTDVSTSGNWE